MGDAISKFSSRKLLIWLVLLLGCLFILPIIAGRFKHFDWNLFFGTFRSLDWGWLAGSWLLALSTYLGRVLRWQVMIAPQRPHSSFWRIFVATAIGFTAVVLFARAGEVVRPYLIAKAENVSFSSQMAAWFLERVYDLLVVLIIFGIALSTFSPPETTLSKGMQWVFHTGGEVVLILSTVCLVFLLSARWISPTWLESHLVRLPLPNLLKTKAIDILHSFWAGMESCRSLRAVVQLIFYTFFEWAIIVGCYLCLFRAFPFGERFTILDIFVFLGFVAFGSIVQLPGIGGGVQFVATAVLNELFLIPIEQASSVAILIWVTTWVLIVPFGLVLAAREGLRWRSLKSLDKETSNP